MKTTLRDHPTRSDRVIVESSVQAEFERSNEAGIARYRAAVEACATPAEAYRVSPDVLPENRWSTTHGYFAEMAIGPRHRRGVYFLGIAQINGCGEREAGTRRWALCDPRGRVLAERAVLEEATLRDLGPLPTCAGLVLNQMGEPAFLSRDDAEGVVDALVAKAVTL